MDNVVIIGAGTYGAVYSAYLKDEYNILGFLDDNVSLHGTSVNGFQVIGGVEQLSDLKQRFDVSCVFAPIGNNLLREKLLLNAQDLGYKTPSFVHPSCNIHMSVEVGQAVYILPESNIMPFTKIQDFCMISMGVNIAHHVILGRSVFLSQGVNVGASISLGNRVFCGIGSTIMTGVEYIAEDSLIGAGAVVIRNVSSNSKMVGNPARKL